MKKRILCDPGLKIETVLFMFPSSGIVYSNVTCIMIFCSDDS